MARRRELANVKVFAPGLTKVNRSFGRRHGAEDCLDAQLSGGTWNCAEFKFSIPDFHVSSAGPEIAHQTAKFNIKDKADTRNARQKSSFCLRGARRSVAHQKSAGADDGNPDPLHGLYNLVEKQSAH